MMRAKPFLMLSTESITQHSQKNSQTCISINSIDVIDVCACVMSWCTDNFLHVKDEHNLRIVLV